MHYFSDALLRALAGGVPRESYSLQGRICQEAFRVLLRGAGPYARAGRRGQHIYVSFLFCLCVHFDPPSFLCKDLFVLCRQLANQGVAHHDLWAGQILIRGLRCEKNGRRWPQKHGGICPTNCPALFVIIIIYGHMYTHIIYNKSIWGTDYV